MTTDGIVVDASVIADALNASPVHVDMTLHAPSLVDYEVAQALRAAVRRRATDHRTAEDFLDGFAGWQVTRHEARFLLPRIWDLRDNLTAYDASYVALAELLGLPLWTHDLHLAHAARHYCDVITD